MSKNNGSYVWRLVGVVLLIGLMVGGGVMAYNAGVTHGVAQAPEVASAISDAAESGNALPMLGYGHSFSGYGMHPHPGFFPIGGVFGVILFIFLFFGLMRMIFRPWGWHYAHLHGRVPWKGYGRYWGPPPWEHEGKEDEAEAEAKTEDK